MRDTRRDSKARSSIELLRAIRDRKGEAITSSLQRRIATVVVASLSRRSTRMRDGGNEARYSILFSYLSLSPFLPLFYVSFRHCSNRARFQLAAVAHRAEWSVWKNNRQESKMTSASIRWKKKGKKRKGRKK